MSEKLRYSDAELAEFREVIMKKLELAKRDYDEIMRARIAMTLPTHRLHTRVLRMAAMLLILRSRCR